MAGPGKALKELVLIVVPVMLVLGLIGAGLHILNLAPPELERIAAASSQPNPEPPPTDTIYTGIKQAGEILDMEILYPNYLPADLIWPPLVVSSDQRYPGHVNILFISADERNSLLFQQSVKDEGPTRHMPPPRESVLATGKRQVSINGASGELMQGISESGKPDTILEWPAGGYAFRISSTYSVEEILRTAESVPVSTP